MSDSGLLKASPPGGECNICPFADSTERSLSHYSWSSASEQVSWSVIEDCPHGPLVDCPCKRPYAPITPRLGRVKYWGDTCTLDIPGSCSDAGSRDSDATVDEIFERPYADPQVSPGQLPPLCGDADSDDELYTAAHEPTTASDGTPVHDDDDDPCHDEFSGMDLLSRTVSWIDALRAYPPTAEDERSQSRFTFTPPSTAPKFPSPLRIECSEVTAVSTLETLALVASLVINKPLYHPRSSADPGYLAEHLEQDQSLVSYLQGKDVLKGKNATATHKFLLAHSDRNTSGSYSTASACIQRSVCNLMTTFPWIRVDFVTPVEVFLCAFPDCDKLIPRTRSAATNHIKDCHMPSGPRPRLECPTCKNSMFAASMGRHLLEQHAQNSDDITVICKHCESVYQDMKKYAAHFPECQSQHLGGENTRATKRRRIGE
ncbi:hypothetical protein B0H12DRAFT_99201 [Mycena haematopus]|nr:hypothetical protein B0H12DRAFT_99201 [Mycena haematopus]